MEYSANSTSHIAVGREKIGGTPNLVRVRYHYATRQVVGGIINSNCFWIRPLQATEKSLWKPEHLEG